MKKTKHVVITRKQLLKYQKVMEAAMDHVSSTSMSIRHVAYAIDVGDESLKSLKDADRVYDELDVAASEIWRLATEEKDER